MTINDLPAIMGTVLIVAGLALVGIYTRFRTEGSEKSVQAGALLIVVGAVLLGLSLFVPPHPFKLGHYLASGGHCHPHRNPSCLQKGIRDLQFRGLGPD